MTHTLPFEVFFDSYVYYFMCSDVSRELAATEQGEDAANFLAALGLLTYTEALGAHVPNVKRGSRNRFEAFFRRLGPEYDTLLDSYDVYDIWRNGMAHGYLPKARSTIVMLDTPGLPLPCGVFVDGDMHVFCVRRYFVDFVVAAAALYKEVMGYRHSLIHIYAPHRLP